jgi:hypothetical protein
MSTEITESAKAVQEVAKAANTVMAAAQSLGQFVANLICEPLELASGMISDRLRFARVKRLLRISSGFGELVKKRGIGQFRRISPKLVLPMLEYASLEDEDELQDLWASLLASAANSSFDGTLRSAFIDRKTIIQP